MSEDRHPAYPAPHPYALMFPPMDEDAFDALLDSIRVHGQREPITVNGRNQIVDGLNRYRACLKLGIQPKYQRRDIADDEALTVVINNNVHRRHLSEAQRAAVAALVRKMKPANLPLTQEAAAKMFNVSVRSIRSAERVMELSPELHEFLVADRISVYAAENLAKLPHRDRAQAIAQTSGAVRIEQERAKRVRAIQNRTSPPAWKKKAGTSKHGAYAEIFSALYDLPQLLVENPLSATAVADLLDELRRAITLLDSGSSDTVQHDDERQR